MTALISTTDKDLAALEARVQASLDKFIAGSWTFHNVQRHSDTLGFERVSFKASLRTTEGEAYNLVERARLASREGLSISDPEVDFSLSVEKVDQVVEELRQEVISLVNRHREDFERTTSRKWRIGDITFGTFSPADFARTTKGAYRDEDLDIQLRDSGGIVTAERIKLVAQVELRESFVVTP